jgi:serine/threonine protein kinase
MSSTAEARIFAATSRFALLRHLGQGAMGDVYEALDRERNTRVALKTLHTLRADAFLRFKNEFRALQDLRHPNLVALDELLETDGTWFLTMELIEGVNFLDWVRPRPSASAEALVDLPSLIQTITGDHNLPVPIAPHGEVAIAVPMPGMGPLDESRLRDALAQLTVGLNALHHAGMVHRDVKPQNMLVTQQGRVVILDFGLVADSTGQAEDGILGTPAFMAPEQGAGQKVGPAADWYAVGTMLYIALTARVPFSGRPDLLLEHKLAHDPPRPSALSGGVPADLDELCMELLRRDPATRPSGRALLERFGRAAPAARPRASAFVGRGSELAVLERALDDVGKRAVALLAHGESGVGKSALVRHFLDELVERGCGVVFPGRCYERESVPYKAVDQVFDAISRYLGALPASEIAPLLPENMEQVASVFPSLMQIEPMPRGAARSRHR